MTVTKDFGRRIEEMAWELEKDFGDLSESDEPLITRIEDWAVAIGDALVHRIMKQKLETQPVDEQRDCPTCQRPGLRKGHRHRTLQTRRGEVSVEEIECYCSHCRKSFFPSVSTVGN